jgi:mannose-6-phosphate isomerase-like protein (cupin superfamily)
MLDKVWGTDETLYSSDLAELHILHMKKGGYTSQHYHTKRHSFLRVVSGSLRVDVFGPYSGCVSSTTLGATESISIGPNVLHKLYAEQDCEVLELYSPNKAGDIVRLDEGGLDGND